MAALRMECLEDPITGGIPDAKGRLQKACFDRLERQSSCSGSVSLQACGLYTSDRAIRFVRPGIWLSDGLHMRRW